MKFNLSLDDFSPHSNAGIAFESIKWCNKLIEAYPDIKIDLFIPAAYCRLGEEPCFIKNYPEWVDKVKMLPSNYRINIHGLYHRRSKIDFKWHSGHDSNNNEWEHLSYQQAGNLLNIIDTEFSLAGMKYHKVFRPPGWYLGAAAAKLLTDRGFVIAGDKNHYGKLSGQINSLRWVSYNWDLISEVPAGDIFAFGHTSTWTNNYIDESKFRLILDVLNSRDFVFKFIGEL